MGEPVYKICTTALLERAKDTGRFDGSADDVRDGFIHLSRGDQVEGTLAKHFAGQEDLVLLAFDAEALGDGLRWEVSRGGDLFPHLYAPLDLAQVLWIEALPLREDGRHRVPGRVLP
jgi:uncharacterized protein (DUF952 family)